MIKDKRIFIKNIYYMMSYAFKELKENNFVNINKEEFEHSYELFAVILNRAISKQVRQGLYMSYVKKRKSLSTIRGRIIVSETIKNDMKGKRLVACEYNELSANNIFNQIIKTTLMILIKQNEIKLEYRNCLKRQMVSFMDVDIIEPRTIKWDTLQYNSINKDYELLMNLCYFILNGFIMTTESGRFRLKEFSEEHISRLYERFVLEYYKKHYKNLKPSASYICWDYDEKKTMSKMIKYLPKMKSDIILNNKKTNMTLIIDTKYYNKITQSYYEKEIFNSGHLYQLYAYVKNKDYNNSGKIVGMLLYAKAEGCVDIDCRGVFGGNEIVINALDLNVDFNIIKEQLNSIVDNILC